MRCAAEIAQALGLGPGACKDLKRLEINTMAEATKATQGGLFAAYSPEPIYQMPKGWTARCYICGSNIRRGQDYERKDGGRYAHLNCAVRLEEAKR